MTGIWNPLEGFLNLARVLNIYMKNAKQRLEMTVVTYLLVIYVTITKNTARNNMD